jgi:hypothetical protein
MTTAALAGEGRLPSTKPFDNTDARRGLPTATLTGELNERPLMTDPKQTSTELTAEALASVTGGARADRLTQHTKRKPSHSGSGVGGLSMRIGSGVGSGS